MRKSNRGWLAIAAGIAGLALAGPAQAQDAGARPHMMDPEKRIERLDETLDLTDAQKAEIRSIFAEQAERGRALRGGGDREAMREHMREHMRETHERVAGVLTAEQREKLESLREERHEGHPRRDGEGRHPREGTEG